jgi:uncharacterized glyoxalase superfamily metalloenzyme YdcJ
LCCSHWLKLRAIGSFSLLRWVSIAQFGPRNLEAALGLGADVVAHRDYAEMANREAFQRALGRETLDELALYERTQQASLLSALDTLDVARA